MSAVKSRRPTPTQRHVLRSLAAGGTASQTVFASNGWYLNGGCTPRDFMCLTPTMNALWKKGWIASNDEYAQRHSPKRAHWSTWTITDAGRAAVCPAGRETP